MPAQANRGAALRQALTLSLEELLARPLAPVIVAVVDSGVDATHPDLAGRVAEARRIQAGEISEVAPGSNNDTYGHGTGVASIIARVAPNARIVDIRVLNPGNVGAGEDLVAGLRLAVRARHPVVNMSLASPPRFAPQLASLCERAFYEDQIVVAARRNTPTSDQGFPAEFASVLGVTTAAVPEHLFLRYQPRWCIELEARGDRVMAAAAGGGYKEMSGTSFAAPAVAGLCALLLGAFPGLRPHEVRALLCAYGEDAPPGLAAAAPR